jgi:4-carboxymuconolactone decarboxylase
MIFSGVIGRNYFKCFLRKNSMTSAEKYLRGIEITKEMAPFLAPRLNELQPKFPEIIDHTIEYALGDIYARPELDMRTKFIIAFTLCVANGNRGNITGYTKHLLHTGSSREEIMAILIHISAYAGFPAVWEALGPVHDGLDAPDK